MSISNNKCLQTKIIFKSNQHAANISEKLLKFYENNEFFDTTIIAGSNNNNIHAHSIVLSAMSEYFLTIFRGCLSPSKAYVIEVQEIDDFSLKSIVDFMYSGWIELSLENVECILRGASVFKMTDLVNGCSEFIAQYLTCNNCLSWLRFANEINLSELKEKCLSVACHQFEEVSKSEELLQLTEVELKDLLFTENPYGDFQYEQLFRSLVAWIDYDKTNRQHLSVELLSNVHYQYLTPRLIIENKKQICKSVECYDLIFDWLEFHQCPETRLTEQKTNCKLAVITDLDCQSVAIQSYEPKLDTWSFEIQKTKKNKPGSSKIVIDGKLIVFGGLSPAWSEIGNVDCLFLNNRKWNRLTSLKYDRIDCQLVNLSGQLCVFGGKVNSHFCMDLEIYNFQKREWRNIKPPKTPSEYSKIVAHNGVLYIIDFENGCLQTYNDLTKTKWTFTAIPKEKLFNYGCTAVGRFLYVFGGYSFDQREWLKTVKRYTITNNTWCEVAPLPWDDCVFSVKTTIVDNRIIVCGGEECYFDFVADYNPVEDTWKHLSQLAKTSGYKNIICTIPVISK